MLVAFASSDYYPLALLALVGVGLGFALFQTLNSTLTLAFTDPAYYGRVSAVMQINNSMASFVIVPIGLLVDALGAPTVMMISGLLIFLFWTFIGLFVRSYRQIEMPARPPEPESKPQPSPAAVS